MSPLLPTSYNHLLDKASLISSVAPDSMVLVAVSGGADSVALLLALLEFQSVLPMELCVSHVNHGLRAEADGDEEFVRKLCDEHGLRFLSARLSVGDKPSGVSPEQWWRMQRYAVFEKHLADSGCTYLALGHNANDLAETFLYHLARGTGISGLSFQFMKRAGALDIIRPFWKTARNGIEQVLGRNGQEFCHDLSNDDLRYSRNLIRSKVLPVLAEINPRIVDAIVAASEQIADRGAQGGSDGTSKDEDFGTRDESIILSDINFELPSLPLARFRDLESDQIASILRQFIQVKAKVPMGRKQTEQAVGMIRSGKTGLVSLAGGCTLVMHQTDAWVIDVDQPTDLQLAQAHPERCVVACSPDCIATNTLQDYTLDGLNGRQWILEFSAETTGIALRNRRSGDRVGSKSLKRLLIQYLVPWYLRDYLVLICDGDDAIVGVVGEWNGLGKRIARHSTVNAPITCIATPI